MTLPKTLVTILGIRLTNQHLPLQVTKLTLFIISIKFITFLISSDVKNQRRLKINKCLLLFIIIYHLYRNQINFLLVSGN